MQKLLSVSLMLLMSAPAAGSEDLYDYICCPKDDCHSAANDPVTMTPDGYHIESLAQVISQDDPRVRVSKDGQFHVCTRSTATPDMTATAVGALMQARTLKCLYVPPFS